MSSVDGRVRRPERGAQALTSMYALAAGLALLLWLTTRWEVHRSSWLERLFGVVNIPLSHSLVSVVVLLLITWALVGRKQVGLAAVGAFQLLGMYLGVVALARLTVAPVVSTWESRRLLTRWLDVVSLIVGTAILIGLWRLRPTFPGHLRRGSWTRLAATVSIGGVATVAATWLLLNVTDQHHGVSEWQQMVIVVSRSLGDLDAETAGELLGVPGWIPQVTSVMISLTLVAAVVLFLRSAGSPTRWSGQREVMLRGLLAGHGDVDSLGYFATRRDKSSIFAPDGRAAVAYRVTNGVSLASGDPIGPPAAWPAAIASWKAEARFYGWLPAVLAASEDGARAYADTGLALVNFGDEAVLEVDRFSLASTSLSEVRHAAHRAQRAGLTVTVRRQQQLTAEELTELTAAAHRWRAGRSERGFSMALNRPADPADSQVVVVTARNTAGEPVGLLTFVPWGRRGASLDVMQRSPTAPNGVTELMVSELMAAAGRLSITRVSLNFCMFRGVFADAARLGASSLTRLNSSVLGVLDRFWQLERLYRANQKYDPQWRPRYLCFDSRIALPQVALAAAVAEGFLPQPRLSQRRHQQPDLSEAELGQLRELETAPTPDPASLGPRRSDQTRQRLNHLHELTAAGLDPYRIGIDPPDTSLAELAAATQRSTGTVRVAGRVTAIRDHGGAVFTSVTDSGHTLQALLESDLLGRRAVRGFARLVDRGDLLLLGGRLGRSRNGTPALHVESWQVAAKSLHPIPFGHFSDPEARLRQRSTALLADPKAAELLRSRTAVIRSLRRTLEAEGFLEVETPILHTVYGGATARPFRTHINAYGLDLSLRIAPELYLKRLLVAGLGAVFEIGRNFRNEGADNTHNPEFTSLEAYLPYADYTIMRHLTEELITAAATVVHGRPALPLPTGLDPHSPVELVDLDHPWPAVPMIDAVAAATKTPLSLNTDFDELLGLCGQHGIEVHDGMGAGALLEELYAELVEPFTISPTFYTDFPRETSPLAGPHRHQPGLVERWDLVVNGIEIGTAYSELTDPLEQRRRLTEQSLKAAAGDPEAMEVDEDFLHALETGMPPTGGLGLGVDRLVMLLTHTNIRSVLTFPFARPKQQL